MPTYEYQCENGHRFERSEPISAAAKTSCDECRAPATRRLFAPAVHFKGSGFYTTDYARRPAKADS